MRKLYLLLTFVMLVGSLLTQAKTVYVSTNLPDATLVGPGTEFGGPAWVYWKGETSITVDIPSNSKGLNIQVNNGYVLTSYTINGEEKTGIITGTLFLFNSEIPDGAYIYLNAQEAAKKTVVINGDPTAISVRYLYEDYDISAWKNNQLTIPLKDATSMVYVQARTGYAMTSVKFNGDEAIDGLVKTYDIFPMGLPAGESVFDITSVNLNDSRTSEFTVDVSGDPKAVEVTRTGDRTVVFTGDALSQPIKFNPEFDLPIYVKSPKYGVTFYKVSVGGEEIPENNYTYSIFDLKDGDKVNVEVDYPNIQIPIRITYVNPETETSIRKISDINTQVISPEIWQVPDWSVKMGTYLTIEFNDDDYYISATLNGVQIENNYVNITAMDEAGYDLVITAEPRDPFTVIFEYALPANFKVQIGSVGEDFVEMDETKTTTEVSVPRNRNRVRIIADEGYVVEYVYVGADEMNTMDIPISGNCKVAVYLREYARDLPGVVYIDPATEWTHRTISLSALIPFRAKTIELEPGYNVFHFNEEDLPLEYEVSVGADHEYPAFLNGEQLPSPVGYLTEFTPGSVLRIYGEYPSFYNARFDISEDAVVTLYKDILDEVEPVSFAEEVMAGTRYDIVPEKITEVVVKVNGVEQTLVEDRYIVNIDAASDITVEKGIPSAVGAIGNGQTLSDVYSLQGIRVLRNATPSQIDSLPAGIYIVAGKKTVVK